MNSPRPGDGSSAPPCWHACRTRARAEKRVEKLLLERGVEAYLPRVCRDRQWADRRKTVEFPLFPGYVFAHFGAASMHCVLSTGGIASVVYMAGRPAPIRDQEIENIRLLAAGLVRTGQKPEPQPFGEGDWVCVSGGPFDGLEGVVTQLRGGRHVLAGLRTLGQGVVVFIETGHLRPLPCENRRQWSIGAPSPPDLPYR